MTDTSTVDAFSHGVLGPAAKGGRRDRRGGPVACRGTMSAPRVSEQQAQPGAKFTRPLKRHIGGHVAKPRNAACVSGWQRSGRLHLTLPRKGCTFTSRTCSPTRQLRGRCSATGCTSGRWRSWWSRQGAPPADVQQWRAKISPFLFPEEQSAKEAGMAAPSTAALERRRCVWEQLLNRDGRRRDQVEHWCTGAECCASTEETAKKVAGRAGVTALLDGLQPLPRKSWQGQRFAAAQVLHLELTHGAISNNFQHVQQKAAARGHFHMHALRQHYLPGDALGHGA